MTADMFQAIQDADDRALLDHMSGVCRDSEWSCSWCERGRGGTFAMPRATLDDALAWVLAVELRAESRDLGGWRR